jgi:large repetitive protein
MKKYLIFLLILPCILAGQTLQRAVLPSAGSSDNPQLQWTLGEVSTTVLSGSGYTLYQGFQQPTQASTPSGNCQINGIIRTENNVPIANVGVALSGSSNQTTTTNAAGEYCFNNVPLNQSVTVTPTRNDNFKNGLTSADLLLIQKHILNQQKLNSPYKIIAADANKSNSVLSSDILVIQRVILNIANTFPNGLQSWRFVPTGHVFSNLQNPFSQAFPESQQVTLATSLSTETVNFIGFKVGDVNGTAAP